MRQLTMFIAAARLHVLVKLAGRINHRVRNRSLVGDVEETYLPENRELFSKVGHREYLRTEILMDSIYTACTTISTRVETAEVLVRNPG